MLETADVWTVDESIYKGKNNSKRQCVFQSQEGTYLDLHDRYKTLCLNQDETSSYR